MKKAQTKVDQVLSCFSDGKFLARRDIIETTGIPAGHVSNQLWVLKNRGKIIRTDKGWTLKNGQAQGDNKTLVRNTWAEDQPLSINPLQTGVGIIAYIKDLEAKLAEAEECVKDRDTLQAQVYYLQEKLNSMKAEGISVPEKYF